MKIPKNAHWNRKPSISCSHIWHIDISKCVHWLDIQSVKVWWKYNNSNMNARQLCIKIPKKSNKIKGRSMTSRHIQHIDTSKYVHWLDTHTVKVWWSYVLPNSNAIHFCDIFIRHRTMFLTCPNKECRESKIRPS